MQEDDDQSGQSQNHSGPAVALDALAEVGQQLRNHKASDQLSEGSAEATGRCQGCTLGVILGHVAQQGAHADVHHGVAAFVDDLQNEGRNHHGYAAAHDAGNPIEGNQANAHNGNGGQNPGTELVRTRLCLGEEHVHQGTHQGVVHSIPDVPHQQHGCQNGRVDLQEHLQITGHIAGHHVQGHGAAPVTAAVADNMLDCQLVRRFVCHNFFLLND